MAFDFSFAPPFLDGSAENCRSKAKCKQYSRSFIVTTYNYLYPTTDNHESNVDLTPCPLMDRPHPAALTVLTNVCAGDAHMLLDKYLNTGILPNFSLYPYNYST
jgi:hypothetical protein